MAAGSHEHEALREQTALYVLGALTVPEHAAFEAHLAACAECAAEVQAFAAVPPALARAVPQIEPSPELRARVLGSVGGTGAAEVRLKPDATDGREALNRAGAPRRSSTPALLAPWLAAAASLALAVGLGAYSIRLRARISELEVALRETFLRVEMSNQQIADARRTAADAQLEVAVLAAPDVARVDLAGLQAAPQAAGRAYWSRASGLVFTAANLPALPPGRAYQLWVIAGQRPPISNGWMIKPDAQGRIIARFDTPLDLPQPTQMAVTIEPENGVPAPTGAMYLAGRVRGS